MNTPSHVLVNCAVVGSSPPRRLWAAVLGAVLPDSPIYAFYAYERLILKLPEHQIWRFNYFASPVQSFIDALHSFPLLLGALGLATAVHTDFLKWLFLSMLWHACADFPLHHDDAHRQLFPLSDYRFVSPISYWDPLHHGIWGWSIELGITAVALAILWRRHADIAPRAAWLGVWLLNLIPLFYWH